MRDFIIAAAIGVALLVFNAIPYWLVAIIPNWLGNALVVFLLGVVPVYAFIRIAIITRRLIKAGE